MQYLLAFLGMVALDVAWAKYTKAIADQKAVKAAVYAIGTVVGGAVVVIGYTTDPWLIVPVGAGAFVGTYISVKFGK